MRPHEFKEQMERLFRTFPRGYPDERVELIWQEFKGVHISDFKLVVDSAIASSRSAPLLGELLDYKARIYGKTKSGFNNRCPTCDNNWWIVLNAAAVGEPVRIKRCHCSPLKEIY